MKLLLGFVFGLVPFAPAMADDTQHGESLVESKSSDRRKTPILTPPNACGATRPSQPGRYPVPEGMACCHKHNKESEFFFLPLSANFTLCCPEDHYLHAPGMSAIIGFPDGKRKLELRPAKHRK